MTLRDTKETVRGRFERQPWSGRVVWVIGVLLLGGVTPVLGQAPPDASVEQGTTPMDQMEMSTPVPPLPVPEPPEATAPFFRDARFGGQARTFYFNRDKYDNTRSEAWAIGGSLAFLSGYVADLIRFGAVGYTSQPLYAPDDHDGTLLLKPGQDGYTVLGQIYGEVKLADRTFLAFGRKEYDTPYINKNDVRMTPNTFEGITVYGKAGAQDGVPAWRFGGGYISKIKEKNSDSFVWMSRDAGANVDRGVYLAGASFAQKNWSIGAIDYYSDDIINIFYSEGTYSLAKTGAYSLKLAAQFSNQRSTGDNLLKGQSFSAHQWGVKGDLGIGPAILTLAYTDTGNGVDMQSPWGGYPGYTSVQVQDFNRAGESAVMVKGTYDLSALGAPGLSAYALWVSGSGRNTGFNEDEGDLNLQWTPKEGALKGASFRLRYAHVKQRGGGDPAINDFRAIVNYDF